jgi:thiol-disulfide isomerase/thioredoxin
MFRKIWLTILLINCLNFSSVSQEIQVVDFNTLENVYLKHPDTTYVVNFFASWCLPCLKELPDFVSFSKKIEHRKIKLIFVSLDIKDGYKESLVPIIEKYGIKVIPTSEVRRNGAENVSRKVLRYLSDCTDIYVSFDVDSLDSAISKGTGTPVNNGLREREAEDLISKFMQNRKVCCFEITEVNPTLDKENLMAEIAFNILQRSVNVLMMN